jgi:hypothetical protein
MNYITAYRAIIILKPETLSKKHDKYHNKITMSSLLAIRDC